MIKSKLIFTFFLCIAAFQVSLAQQDTSRVRVVSSSSKVPPPHYDYFHFTSDSLFKCALKEKKLTAYYSIVSIVDTVAGIPKKRSGVLQANKIIVPFEYDTIRYTTRDEFICRKHIVNRRTYACNYFIYQASSKTSIDFKASAIDYIGNNVYVVRTGQSHVFFNSQTGHTTPAFDTYSYYDSLFIITSRASEQMLFDRSANDFIVSPFKRLIQSNDSTYNAVLYNEWDIYKNTGEKIISRLRCDSIKPSSEFSRWNLFRNDSAYYRWNFTPKDTSRKPVLATENYSTQLNITRLKYDTLKTFLHFDSAYYQSDNLLMYKKAGAYGYCDTVGNVKISHQYDTITAWHDGMAAIRFKKKWGYVTKREQLTVQPYYIIAMPFVNGAAAVYDGKRWMFTSKEGKNLNSITFDSIQQTSSGKWYVYNKGLVGLCDNNGKELIPPMYEFLLDANSDVYVFQKEFLYGLIAKDRTILCQPTYDQFIYDKENDCYLLKYISQSGLLFMLHKD
ncbi:WG repeat-containing protein [Cytophaga aurantiaca]|uniref:WG repeat-containing protein n=1 Tax=Cytophaga aurantiaca TaxID=29530 RepID=UPI0003666322|nr:WG repeat-containing protein [Cytophaga aurantiaca]